MTSRHVVGVIASGLSIGTLFVRPTVYMLPAASHSQHPEALLWPVTQPAA